MSSFTHGKEDRKGGGGDRGVKRETGRTDEFHQTKKMSGSDLTAEESDLRSCRAVDN